MLGNISAYDFLTNFLPGLVLVSLCSRILGLPWVQGELVADIGIYFFVGVVVSRLSSLIVEPVLKLSRFVEFGEYTHFLMAEKRDSKIHTMLEVQNFFRALFTAQLCFWFVVAYEAFYNSNQIDRGPFFLILISTITMLLAYRKQAEYLKKRIQHYNQ